MKAATVAHARKNIYCRISIHAAREGGDYNVGDGLAHGVISIHAAREGGDPQRFPVLREARDISIHAAREGGDGHLSTAS